MYSAVSPGMIRSGMWASIETVALLAVLVRPGKTCLHLESCHSDYLTPRTTWLGGFAKEVDRASSPSFFYTACGF